MFSFFKKFETPAEPVAAATAKEEKAPLSWLERLKAGLSRTSASIGDVFSRRKIDDELLEAEERGSTERARPNEDGGAGEHRHEGRGGLLIRGLHARRRWLLHW